MWTTPTVMITGGCGFIGSDFIHHLLQETRHSSNAHTKIVNFDCLSPPASSRTNVDAPSAERCVLVAGNLSNAELLDRTLSSHRVAHLVHFAALTHVGDSFKRPEEFLEANVRGTLCLLEAARRYGHLKTFDPLCQHG